MRNLDFIRIRAAAVRSPNTLIKYTENSGPPVSTLIRLCHFHLIVEGTGDMGVQFYQELSKFVTSFICSGQKEKLNEPGVANYFSL